MPNGLPTLYVDNLANKSSKQLIHQIFRRRFIVRQGARPILVRCKPGVRANARPMRICATRVS